MKKKICAGVILILVLAVFAGCAETEEEAEMDVVQTQVKLMPQGAVESIVVVTNTKEVEDKEACAQEIIAHCVANDFHNVRFSYDRSGYPVELHAKVYLKKEDMKNGEPVFEMDYEQDEEDNYQYNIKDNPEKFHLTIR